MSYKPGFLIRFITNIKTYLNVWTPHRIKIKIDMDILNSTRLYFPLSPHFYRNRLIALQIWPRTFGRTSVRNSYTNRADLPKRTSVKYIKRKKKICCIKCHIKKIRFYMICADWWDKGQLGGLGPIAMFDKQFNASGRVEARNHGPHINVLFFGALIIIRELHFIITSLLWNFFKQIYVRARFTKQCVLYLDNCYTDENM